MSCEDCASPEPFLVFCEDCGRSVFITRHQVEMMAFTPPCLGCRGTAWSDCLGMPIAWGSMWKADESPWAG